MAAAGQLETWSGTYPVGDLLRLEAAPGHTPGSAVLWLRSGPGAAFVGDLVHTPAQLARPGDSCAFDLDKGQARDSRRRVLAEAARTGAMVLPAHFADRSALTIEERDGAFGVREWAAL